MLDPAEDRRSGIGNRKKKRKKKIIPTVTVTCLRPTKASFFWGGVGTKDLPEQKHDCHRDHDSEQP